MLDSLLATLRSNFVPPFLVRKLFEQLFSFINVQLFNQLLLRRECCSFSNGEYVKTGLSEVELWVSGAGRGWLGDSWEQLAHIRQVCGKPIGGGHQLEQLQLGKLDVYCAGAMRVGPRREETIPPVLMPVPCAHCRL